MGREALGMMRAIISVVILTGRLGAGSRACAHQAGSRGHAVWLHAGALDVSVPLGRGRAGCCISQLGRNQFNGPFKMCIKILRIPHFNIKYS